MFERSLNVFWILLGAAAATYAWTLGLAGPSGPESGLFPFIAALIVMGAGVGDAWENITPVMSMRVDGPGAWRNSKFSTNNADTICISDGMASG